MISVVLGKRGMGKSTYCKDIVRNSVYPCLVIDTMNEYDKEAILLPVTEDIEFNKFKIRVVPESDEELSAVMRMVTYLRYRHGINVIIDEVDYWSSSHYIPLELENGLKFSRHYHLNFWLTVRNPSEIHRKITGLADEFIIFRITEPLYLDYFRRFDAGLPEKITKLQPHQFIRYVI